MSLYSFLHTIRFRFIIAYSFVFSLFVRLQMKQSLSIVIHDDDDDDNQEARTSTGSLSHDTIPFDPPVDALPHPNVFSILSGAPALLQSSPSLSSVLSTQSLASSTSISTTLSSTSFSSSTSRSNRPVSRQSLINVAPKFTREAMRKSDPNVCLLCLFLIYRLFIFPIIVIVS
jgi:hypothetical protein